MTAVMVYVASCSFLVGLAGGAFAISTFYYRREVGKSMVTARDPSGRKYKFKMPNWNRFCHICGADSFKREKCDSGRHS
ncbi:MAG: hypothetical protein UY48_C0009G0020 [Candidatus Gottesmanbacteria bacterium GW2011_GWB1_49_7]|uniref:Uncharacterized protein n=1 Tax=Candidatus Gottesmanbacteria bacterium GW2011_GWB1_49_7 TaxID=1618448 RepID=A0A0G1YCW0_9BACT|nr:MAG: hypothetical protein UY48_C0009G0020 [Candidatus Gottesmanbacteria bacterium GW2011_GWB1_49_7]